MKKVNKSLYITLTLLLAIVVSPCFSQDKYLDKNGTIVFEASEKLFEEVKATNKSSTAIYNNETHEIAALALIKGFRFKNSLMEEHFNENYIESDTYPKAIFKGTLIDFNSKENLGNTPLKVNVIGVLELHGKQKNIDTVFTIQKINDTISITGDFIVKPSDFDIEIPKIVHNKIAKEVQVSIDFKLVKK